MEVIKRDGRKVEFDKSKIVNAIMKAMEESDEVSRDVANRIANEISKMDVEQFDVEEIQDQVEEKLMNSRLKKTARAYVRYRYDREKNRALSNDLNQRYEQFVSLINGFNEEANKENSNKDTRIIPTMRDYLAGFTCKEMAQKMIIPKDIVEAHNAGIIHFHDMDYSPAMPMHNCGLVNLEDMLQNGTVISGTMIEKPHSFRTACTVTTQIIAQVASSQYGGQTITLSHLAPFVDVSRQKIKKQVISEYEEITGLQEPHMSREDKKIIDKITEDRVKEEIKSGVQTIQYQLITLMTTNGQAAFCSVFMYLGEVEDERTKKDLALIIEEVLKQRIEGVKNEKGAPITTAFPKLLYCLEEDNIHEDSPYWYLTKLAAECSAKRLVPDYISEKKMKELKEGNVFPCMGCVDGNEIITYKFKNKLYVESFERMWDRFSQVFDIIIQPNNVDKFINLSDVEVYDTKQGFVQCHKLIRNTQDSWIDVNLKGGRRILVTEDHPFETENRGVVQAKDLKTGDQISINYNQYSESYMKYNNDLAWLLGFMLCDGCYHNNHVFGSIALTGEDEIEEKWINTYKKLFDIDTKVIKQERGRKGNYKDLALIGKNDGKIQKLINLFTSKFRGINKKDRHIPNEVFSWTTENKYAFLAGMIDADGYINPTTHGGSCVQIGSTNKELALQQMALAQSLNMDTKIYYNHYNPRNKNAIRYRIEFIPDDTLVNNIVCSKKKNNYISRNITNKNIVVTGIAEINSVHKQQYSYDVETNSEHFEFSGVYSHNCRSFLQPYYDEDGKPKFYGRFNQGVVTISLPDIALYSGGDMDKFWRIFDERLELCYRALMIRHNTLKGTKSDVAPILWQHGAYARLKPGETIDKMLYNDYSSISLGYAGLYECVKYMTGESHTEKVGHDFGIKVMKKLNDACNEWKKETGIGFSLYGAPIEATTEKFAKCLQKRFGIIKGITDKNYVTNSYHITPSQNIDAFSKLSFESEFQELSLGGSISYIETPNMEKNIDAILEVIKYIYETIMYAEINTTTSYCHICGCTDIKMEDDLKFHCPQCGNDDFNKMNIALRICGYISTNPFNDGRAEDIHDRVYHLGME